MTVKNKIKQLEDKINKICRENSNSSLENIKIITEIQKIKISLEKLENNSNENILHYLKLKKFEYALITCELKKIKAIDKSPQLLCALLLKYEHKLELINEMIEDVIRGNL